MTRPFKTLAWGQQMVSESVDNPARIPVTRLPAEQLADAAEVHELDGAMFSIWLHSNWFWLTRNMTTPQKEAAAAAVLRHKFGDGDPETTFDDRQLRWWRPEYQVNSHGVDIGYVFLDSVIRILVRDRGAQVATVHSKPAAFIGDARLEDGSMVRFHTDDVIEVLGRAQVG